ncbi:NAD-dependent succinate-semialdehyde dehydrogenase [Corynebacterium nuruki]|uniref:NAD-dependent succinate-semialdehyde dehydrogenase n=2 Tax=Corynebacterium nuruki TaxID=1032851 RepID=UPI000248666F|nr:NAD-dependent succinate-semialdehyde dehydrogenase [Corynebacterium nuruki]
MPEVTTTLLPTVPTDLWLAGHRVPASSGETFAVEDPATGEVIAHVADATLADADAALDAAVAAAPVWAKTSPRHRTNVLTRIFDLVTERTEDLARTMTVEMGKPLGEARGEVAYGNEYFRWAAEEAARIPGRFGEASQGNGHMLMTRTPVGPVLAITPWNFPLAMATRKIAPALAAGCPIIVKPAAETPLTMLLLGEIIAQAFAEFEVPAGLVSILPTTGAAGMSEHLMADRRLRKVTFTGSTPVGRTLVRQSADNLQRTSMELGGNAPFVVTADADIPAAVAGAMVAKLRNGGQVCVAANRFLVDNAVAAEFTAGLVAAASEVRQGHGLDEGVTLGPLITAKQRARVHDLVTDAVARGARLLLGGELPEGPGNFYPATVLADVPADAPILAEEIFGPVATITTFDGVEAGVAAANDTDFGLAAYGYAGAVTTAQYLTENLQAGMVALNRGQLSEPAAPFGGIGQSGFGREGGTEGIEEYLDVRYLALP